MTATATDRIEKEILLQAPRSRVWRALTDAREFGEWFGVKLDGQFEVGKTIKGRITNPGYDHLTLEATVERIDPETVFSFRWHPNATDPNVDYSGEPTTLVEFRVADAKDGTLLTVTESGFDKIPAARRNEAFIRNGEGWAGQVKRIQRYVTS